MLIYLNDFYLFTVNGQLRIQSCFKNHTVTWKEHLLHFPSLKFYGLFFIKQPLDFESRRLYTLKVEAENTHVDPRFYYLGPFKDTTIVKISIEDVDEPPVFSRSSYLFEVHEDIEVGTIIGTVMARDPDSTSSAIR